jgi:serine/threonine protein kinase
VDYIRRERQILDSLQYDGIAKLHFTFQDAYSLYLGLEYCPNGGCAAATLPPPLPASSRAAAVPRARRCMRRVQVIAAPGSWGAGTG